LEESISTGKMNEKVTAMVVAKGDKATEGDKCLHTIVEIERRLFGDFDEGGGDENTE